ncbi:MAG: FMN-binding protein [Actinomycetales bacterium]|nr:FMN-binding protein [Actinomycetales bacterium]
MTRWGPVQVAATVSGKTVCEVHAVSWPSNDGRSQMINAYAIPILDQSATASKGTQLDFVSGATYTSNGYAQSLQSLLDQL